MPTDSKDIFGNLIPDFGIEGGLASYLPGQESAFNPEAIREVLSGSIEAGLANLPTSIGGKTEEQIIQDIADFLAAQDATDYGDLNLNTTANELTNGVDMLDPEATGLGGDESIVTDDEKWDRVDKTEDLGSLLQDALDIFGLGNLDKAIVNVADVVNDRNISVQDVAAASGNTVEYVNDAFEKAGVKINNQGEVIDDDTVTTGGDSTTTTTTTTTGGGAWQNTGGGVTETVGDRQIGDGLIVPKRDVVVDDRPKTILPALPKPEPKQTMNLTLMQSIVNDTPVTESILFPTKFTKLENVQQGMFGEFLRAAGGRR